MTMRNRRRTASSPIVARIGAVLVSITTTAMIMVPYHSSDAFIGVQHKTHPVLSIGRLLPLQHQQRGTLLSPYKATTSKPSRLRLSATINTDENIDEAARLIDTSNDPFVILGIQPTTDQKLIKRAYKRRALKFHPDVVVTTTTSVGTTSNKDNNEKKIASDRFAKINWAYQTLSGQRDQSTDRTYGGGTGTSSSSTTNTGWSPPHRRSSGSYGTSSSSSSYNDNGGSGFSTDWRDYMPRNDDDEQYDANGDSFEKIFSDLFATAATGAVGMAGTGANLFVDFIEFLEGNVDGYSRSSSSSGSSPSPFGDADDELRVLLRTGSFEEIADEMDDTQLVVDQLRSKLLNLDDEILTVTAESKMTKRYMERIELEERLAELNARKDVVNGYVKRSQKRLLALQTRYKELMSQGTNDPYAGGGRSTTRTTNPAASRESPTSSGYKSTSNPSRPSSSSSSTSSQDTTASSRSGSTSVRSNTPSRDADDAWMNEGFGSSSGRGSRSRGSSRRRARRSSQAYSSSSSSSTGSRGSDSTSSTTATGNYGTGSPAASNNSSPRSTEYTSNSNRSRTSSDYSNSSSSATTSTDYRRESVRSTSTTSSTRSQSNQNPSSPSSLSSVDQSTVPPHRRTSSYASRQEEDKRRMQEIKVDEEFEKLKKELGL